MYERAKKAHKLFTHLHVRAKKEAHKLFTHLHVRAKKAHKLFTHQLFLLPFRPQFVPGTNWIYRETNWASTVQNKERTWVRPKGNRTVYVPSSSLRHHPKHLCTITFPQNASRYRPCGQILQKLFLGINHIARLSTRCHGIFYRVSGA